MRGVGLGRGLTVSKKIPTQKNPLKNKCRKAGAMEKNIEQVLSSFDVTKMLAQVTADQKNIMHDLRVRKNFDSIPSTLSKNNVPSPRM